MNFYKISKNTFFTEHLWATASGQLAKKTLTLYYYNINCEDLSYETFDVFIWLYLLDINPN